MKAWKLWNIAKIRLTNFHVFTGYDFPSVCLVSIIIRIHQTIGSRNTVVDGEPVAAFINVEDNPKMNAVLIGSSVEKLRIIRYYSYC